MSPTEQKILTSFLLPPAPLSTIISLSSFIDLFPRTHQSSPAIRILYRDLQLQRARTIDAVTSAIEYQARRGIALRRDVVRARRIDDSMGRDGKVNGDAEVEVEITLATPLNTSSIPVPNPHSIDTIIPDLEKAVEDIEDEIRRMEEETQDLVVQMKGTVGGLSDLRYGRFGEKGLRQGVLEGLDRVERVCEDR